MSGQYANEAGLVRALQRTVAKRWPDAWVFKVVGSPMQMIGVPDLLVVVEGLLIGAEAKYRRPGESLEHARGRATAQQVIQMDRIVRAGGVAGVVTSPEELVDLVERGLKEWRELRSTG